MPDTSKIHALACEIASVVRREGHHDFKSVGGGHECSTASFCGMCVHSDGDQLLHIHAADLDIEFGTPANEPSKPFMRFRRGNAAGLADWHRQLVRLHAVLTPLQRKAA